MRELSAPHSGVIHLHATGKRDYEKYKKAFYDAGLSESSGCTLTDYIYDMDKRMAECDLLVSRAGAMTVSELALLSKAAVIVPSPYVAANHQYKNAKAIYDKGGCELVQESEFESGRLLTAVVELLDSPEKRRDMGEKITAFAKPDANRIIYDEIKRVMAEKK